MLAWCARTSANTPGIISGGLLSATDCQLSAPGSGLSVNVSTGEAVVGGSEGGTQGGYGPVRVSSTTNLAISTANPTNPRIDTVCVTIADTGYTEPTGVSGNAAVLQVVTGTPTSGANLTNLSGKAALPLSSLLLGYVLVPAGANNIITADIANKAAVVNLGAAGLNYLQLLSAKTLQLAYGNGAASFTTGNLSTGTSTVPHGLGRVPSAYVAFMDVRAGNNATFSMATAQAADATNLYLYGVTTVSPGSNFGLNFYWIAIG